MDDRTAALERFHPRFAKFSVFIINTLCESIARQVIQSVTAAAASHTHHTGICLQQETCGYTTTSSLFLAYMRKNSAYYTHMMLHGAAAAKEKWAKKVFWHIFLYEIFPRLRRKTFTSRSLHTHAYNLIHFKVYVCICLYGCHWKIRY